MPQHTREQLRQIYYRTDGVCHLCREDIALDRYGVDSPLGWEVDHSNPKAHGGTDRLSNLLPAHPHCNRAKGAGSNREIRARHGFTRAPMSREAKMEHRLDWALGLGVPALILAGPVLGIVMAGLAFLSDPDRDERDERRSAAQ